MHKKEHYNKYEFITKNESVFLNFSESRDGDIPHNHDFYELVAIISGSGTHTINDITYKVMPGDIFLLNYNDYHSLTPINAEHTFKWLSCLWLSDFYQINDRVLLKTKKYQDEYTLDITNILLDMMREYNLKRTNYLDIIKLQLITLMKKLSRIGENEDYQYADKYKHNVVKNAVQFINTNYKNKMSLQDVADHVAISQVYLCKLFKERVDMGVIQYLRKVRINKAIELLLTTDCTINVLSESVGFTDVKSFYMAFRAQTGVSPASYKKHIRGEGN